MRTIRQLQVGLDTRHVTDGRPDAVAGHDEVRLEIVLPGGVAHVAPAHAAAVAQQRHQLRLGTPSSPPPSATPSPPAAAPPPPPVKDQELTQMILTVLTANRADFSQLEAIKVAAQDGEITLSGLTPTRAERALVERLTKEVAGVKSVKNLIVLDTR